MPTVVNLNNNNNKKKKQYEEEEEEDDGVKMTDIDGIAAQGKKNTRSFRLKTKTFL